MRATLIYAAGDVRIGQVPDPVIAQPTDALVRVLRSVLECVGLEAALDTAFAVVRAGGTVSRVGAPQYQKVTFGFPDFLRNITLTGGVAPARAYIDELLPDILDGTIDPGRVFDRTVPLDQVPDGYRAMAARDALKVMITP